MIVDDFMSALTPVVVRLDTVAPELVEWVWPGRIPRGKLTLLIGDPGVGKSFLALDIAARVSRGAAWPDGGRAPASAIVLLSAEDGLADTIRPRLDTLNAEVSRIHALTAMREAGVDRSFSLETDLDRLETVIQNTGAILVGVDPLSAYLGDRDSYKDSEIRGLLGPLAALAERTKTAIVAIIHLTKDQQRKALYRALGSIAFVAAARVVLALGKDPEDEDRRILVTVKNNLTTPAPALAFTLTRGVLDWYADPVDGMDADALLSPATEEPGERQDAKAFLEELLADGDVRATEALKAARAHGVSERTLRRARRDLGVTASRVGGAGKAGAWFWTLTPKVATTTDAKMATPGEVAALRQSGDATDGIPPTSPKRAMSQGMAPLVAASGYEIPHRSSLPPKSWP
ncbi:MAG TPA: AAA family ATPase [Methylomirabilota bacterium]|jgi:hypothetical protein|nr:AAA family ATPase [Methylomirabilota bacterium]